MGATGDCSLGAVSACSGWTPRHMDMKEVDHREHIYVMVPILGLTLNEMQTDGQSIPKAGLLVTVLSLILLAGDRVSEENIWGALSRMGVFAGIKHCMQPHGLQHTRLPCHPPSVGVCSNSCHPTISSSPKTSQGSGFQTEGNTQQRAFLS